MGAATEALNSRHVVTICGLACWCHQEAKESFNQKSKRIQRISYTYKI